MDIFAVVDILKKGIKSVKAHQTCLHPDSNGYSSEILKNEALHIHNTSEALTLRQKPTKIETINTIIPPQPIVPNKTSSFIQQHTSQNAQVAKTTKTIRANDHWTSYTITLNLITFVCICIVLVTIQSCCQRKRLKGKSLIRSKTTFY